MLGLFSCLTAIAIQSCILNKEAPLKPFKVGLNNWSGYQIAIYAKESGLFRKHGLEVEFVTFINQQDSQPFCMRGSVQEQ